MYNSNKMETGYYYKRDIRGKNMRFIKERFPSEEDFIPENEGFIPVKEPDQEKMLKIISILANVLIILAMIIYIWIYGFNGDIIIKSFIISILIIVPHELVHALLFPSSIFSDKIVIGSYIKGGVFYAHYSGEMSKRRFIIDLLGPFTIFTVIPIMLSLFIYKNELLVILGIINGVASIGDLIGTGIILKNVPKNSIVRNKGYKTYFNNR